MHDSNWTTAFAASVTLVLEEIKNVKELHQSTHSTKRLPFAIDVCLVAHGVRTGYLVDAVCPPNPMDTLGTLLMALREKSVAFRQVIVWHHTSTSQSFLVHASLLQERITALLGGARGCVFVKLDTLPSVSRDPPRALMEALCGMRSAMRESPDALIFPLCEQFTTELLIPLAAVLIDYPVAYFPAFPAQTSFLEGQALDIYTLSFKWAIKSSKSSLNSGGEHVLLKFSCPQALASDHADLLPSIIMKRLHAGFAGILERVGAAILVTHGTETLDRVAL